MEGGWAGGGAGRHLAGGADGDARRLVEVLRDGGVAYAVVERNLEPLLSGLYEVDEARRALGRGRALSGPLRLRIRHLALE